MKDMGFGTDFAQLEAYYESRLLQLAAKALPNRTLVSLTGQSTRLLLALAAPAAVV